jgi:isocitrate/isopropylmalate dehydrogenase
MRQSKFLRSVTFLSCLTLSSGLAAGALLAAEPGGIAETVQKQAYEITGKDVATIKLGTGSSALSAAEQSELRTMYQAVRDNARVREIIVAAYSDHPYPSGPSASLPSSSRRLAEKRGTEVKKFLAELGAKNIRVVNMAQKANWFERTFDTKDSQIKHESSEKDSNASSEHFFYDALGAHLQASAGPSNVVVVIRHD